MPLPTRILPLKSLLLGAALLTTAAVAATRPPSLAADERWRVTASQPAPWAPGQPSAADIGAVWQWTAAQLRVDGLPDCARPAHVFVLQPPEGLFQGLLPAPAARSAQALGIRPGSVLTQRIDCANGSFDLHHVGPDRLLTALDKRILTLQRSAGASTPLAAAQALLVTHFSGDMAFTPASTQAKAAWLSPSLQQRIAAWMARPQKADEVPDINGDPYTDSQEYPEGFELRAPVLRGEQAEVPVLFHFGAQTRRVVLLLQRQGGRWLLDDVRYGRQAPTLRQSLN